jgi:uncharacterized membrane protein YidH (DUF202 family)
MKTVGRMVGCTAAILIIAVASSPLLFGLAWSGAHCDPAPQCQHASEEHFGAMLAGVAGLAAITGGVIGWIVNVVAARRDDEGTSLSFVVTAAVAALLFAALVIVAAFQALDLMTA